MSVETKIREDVENLFTDVVNRNFDGVLPEEVEDIGYLIPYLVETFPEEAIRVLTNVSGKVNIKK